MPAQRVIKIKGCRRSSGLGRCPAGKTPRSSRSSHARRTIRVVEDWSGHAPDERDRRGQRSRRRRPLCTSPDEGFRDARLAPLQALAQARCRGSCALPRRRVAVGSCSARVRPDSTPEASAAAADSRPLS
jgi:hypothetical protein